MENFHAPWISFVLLALVPFLLKNPFVAFCHNTPNHETDQPRTYIIQLETSTASLDEENLKIWYKSFLPESNNNSERLLHSYSEVFSGFAAKLTEEEVKNMAKKEGFLRAHPDRVLPLHTTHTDPVSIAAFRASVEKGVFVSCSAGNDGPSASTLSNVAPWVLTVAATTMDRSLQATVELGDGRKINAESMDQPPNFPEGPVPLFITDTSYDYHSCYTVSEKVKGKVAVCQADGLICTGKAATVKAAGGIGMIIVNLDEEGYTMVDRSCNFPTASVPFNDGNPIITYVNSTSNATGTISFRGTVLGVTPAPAIAHFSSRGPAPECYSIIKPDISGPGVNILAAWIDRRTANDTFVIKSGTSMAAPHLSGVAALVKSLHPDWSAAAIKSAIMTTSDDKDRQGRFIQDQQRGSASFYAMGAGHVNPSKAVDPGLIYDLDIDDYIAYICGKYGDAGAKAILRGRSIKCETVKNLTEAQLNYPTITLTPRNATHTVSRTVTNVGSTNSSYQVKVNVPDTVFLTVEPQILKFTKVNEKKSFTVSAKWKGRPVYSVEGKLRWISDKHVVRSPIVISDRQV
ncbi:Peptidase inhibitor I9 [Musa troglodytarum]|uniref:Peptidase inhibitor I9 n=1 Tax=Musa troglodytarum TaxID=320322 RepID=A0A9E7GM63_9LILI|nr:Peptidase inhibitor I9 [Musa troglodytarum]